MKDNITPKISVKEYLYEYDGNFAGMEMNSGSELT
jgi:hypothetical protein